MTSSLARRPGSRGRPGSCRRGLPVHERQPGRLPGRRHGPCARRVEGRLLRLGGTRALGAGGCRRRTAEAHPYSPSRLAPDLWRAARARWAAGRRRKVWPQASGPAHAGGGPCRCQPPPRRPGDDAARQGGPSSAGPGGSGLQCDRAGPARAKRCFALGWQILRSSRPRRGSFISPSSWTPGAARSWAQVTTAKRSHRGHDEPSACRTGGRGAADGGRPAQTQRRYPS